jgi:hypothetical protein
MELRESCTGIVFYEAFYEAKTLKLVDGLICASYCIVKIKVKQSHYRP